MKSQEQIIDKVRKLLNMTTEKGCTEDEAATAATMAQALLFKHNLSMAEIQDINEASTIGEERERYDVGKNSGFWVRDLAFAVAQYNFCQALVGTYRGHNSITLIGEAHNIEVAKEIFRWLADQLQILHKQAWKDYSGYEPKGRFKRAFFEGAVNTVRSRLWRQWMNLQNDNEGSTALVIVKEKEIKKYMEEKHPHSKPARESNLSGYHGYAAGREAGQKVNLTVSKKISDSGQGRLS